MKRRTFIRTAALSGAALAGMEVPQWAMPTCSHAFPTGGGINVAEGIEIVEAGKAKNVMPEIRPEILNNPRAVFLIETNVSASPDARGNFMEARPQLEQAGKKLVRELFVKGSRKGGSTLVKPNFTTVPDRTLSPVVGINTAPDFVAGFIEGLRELGNTNVIVSDRGTDVVNHRQTGIYEVLDAHKIDLIEANYDQFSHYRKDDLNWHKVPNPVLWKNIPTYRPIGDPDNFFINMPKLKCHNLGLTTLSTKNLQGAVPTAYGHYCDTWDALPLLCKTYGIDFKRDFVENYQQRVEAAFLKHRDAGFKHWDKEQSYSKYQAKGGWDAFRKVKDSVRNKAEFMKGISNLMWDEQWCQRGLDSSSAIKPSINIIEGVIGRDGSGFDVGKDELCNIIVVGLSTTEVDAVGSYIMGHNPMQLIYTRIAKERGLGENDVNKIDLYWIRNGVVSKANVADIKRYRLGVNLHTWAETGERLFW
ncbi:MAG: DUF362 domain-containing protein [Candidatus Latescibacter sp.]|nr:DUF362 domain-containing protein [Candidatus Latescibacter sp.]